MSHDNTYKPKRFRVHESAIAGVTVLAVCDDHNPIAWFAMDAHFLAKEYADYLNRKVIEGRFK